MKQARRLPKREFRTKKEQVGRSWWNAYGWAILIFLFFVIATTWFPSWLMSKQVVATAPSWVSDLVGSGAWFVPLAVGLVGLRWLQKTERI